MGIVVNETETRWVERVVREAGIAVVMTELEIVSVIVIVEQLRDAQILDDELVLDLSYAVYRASHKTSKIQNIT